MKILAIDTASARCSAALWLDGTLTVRAVPTGREHARLLLPMVDELLDEAGVQLAQLDGLAFGRGPGSFTGVRVACSVVQGLAFGAGLGVLPVSDLRALAAQALRSAADTGPVAQVVSCMDARMGEVYWSRLAVTPDGVPETGAAEYVMAPDRIPAEAPQGLVLGAGAGLGAWPQLAARLGIATRYCFPDMEPEARDIAELAARELAAGTAWLPPEAAQPVYLRNNVTFVKENRPL